MSKQTPQEELAEHMEKAIRYAREAREYEARGEPLTAAMFLDSADRHAENARRIKAEIEQAELLKQVTA